MEKNEILEKLGEWLQEKDMYSELRNTPEGPFLLLEDCEEEKAIDKFLEEIGYNCESGFDLCSVGFKDSYATCDCCGRVVETIATSAFWKAPFILTDDGLYCAKCVEFDDMVEHINHKFGRCDTIFNEKDYIEHGYTNFTLEKYGVETCEEVKDLDYEDLMNAAANYKYACYLLVSSTPFEAETKLFVLNE